MPSLRWRLVSVLCLAYILVAAASGAVEYYAQVTSLHAQLRTRARSDATILAAGAVASLNAGGALKSDVLQDFVLSIENAEDVKFARISSDNRILASTLPSERGRRIQPVSLQPTHAIQLPNGDVEGIAPVVSDLTDLGTAEVTISGSSVSRDVLSNLFPVLVVRLGGVLVFLLLSLSIAQYVLGPLRQLVQAAGAIRRGEMSARVQAEGKTELQTVASTFNGMAFALQQRFRYLSFLASSGRTLPTAFREGSDVEPILQEFSLELHASGAGLVPRSDTAFVTPHWAGIQFDSERWPRIVADATQNATTTTVFEDGFALLIIPVLTDAAFLVVRAEKFSSEEEQMAVNFAYQFALAADNARLFAAQQEALQVKDQFLSIVSHELRTPLTTIKGYAQMLRRKLEDSPDDQRFAANIDAQVGRLSRLVDDLLDVTRFSRGEFELSIERTDIRPSLREVISRFELTATSHTFRLALDEGSFEGEWDHGRLEQVLNNLVGNAVKYSPEGGEVVISTKHDGDSLVIAVRDHGVGIPDEDQNRIFDRFFRGAVQDRNIKGLGLGLYVTQKIVEAHGGTVGINPVSGQGSEFFFTLPLHTGRINA